MICSHCSAPLTGRQQVKFCSRACAGKDNEDWSPPPMDPRVTLARNDMARIGAVHMAWDGRPMLLSELAEMIGEPEMAAWAGLLRPWVEAIHTDAGPLVYARMCGSDEVRAAVAKHTRGRAENKAICNLQTADVWMEEEAA